VLDRAQSPLRVAARRADGGDRPRARRVQAVGQAACGKGQFSPAYSLRSVVFYFYIFFDRLSYLFFI